MLLRRQAAERPSALVQATLHIPPYTGDPSASRRKLLLQLDHQRGNAGPRPRVDRLR
jgi:hypothetical protein